jgi:hypothetical protein
VSLPGEARRSPLKSLGSGLEAFLEGLVQEDRLFKFKEGRTFKYTDQILKARNSEEEDSPGELKP